MCLRKMKTHSKNHNQSPSNSNYLKLLSIQSMFKFPRLMILVSHVQVVYLNHYLKILSTLSTGLDFLISSSNILAPFIEQSTKALCQEPLMLTSGCFSSFCSGGAALHVSYIVGGFHLTPYICVMFSRNPSQLFSCR